MEKKQLLDKLHQVFTPIQPIQEKDFFRGRLNQLTKIVEALNEKGQHAILYGERGVGKTSLANIMYHSYTNIYPIKITCESTHTFQSLWQKAFSKISYSRTIEGVGFVKTKKEELVSMTDCINCNSEIDTSQIVDMLNKLGDDFRIMFIFDEFDNINDTKTKRSFADLIKSLSDNNINSTIVLVGIADSIEELIGNHQSLERCLKQVKMPRMKIEECKEIITKGIEFLGFRMDKEVLDKIIEFSSGFPHYVHLLCKFGCMELIQNDKDNFSMAYLTIAINKGIEDTSEQLRFSYRQAISTANSSEKWKHILSACASCRLDEFNTFSIANIVEQYNKIMSKTTKRVSRNSDINYNVNTLTKVDRGEILLKLGRGQSTRYTFKNPMMRAFIKLKMNESVC